MHNKSFIPLNIIMLVVIAFSSLSHAMDCKSVVRFKPALGPVLVALSGNKAITGEKSGAAKIWNIETGKLLHEFKIHQEAILEIAAQGDKVVTGTLGFSDKNCVKIWDINTGKILHQVDPDGNINSIAIDGNRVVTGSDSMILIWDINTGEQVDGGLRKNKTWPFTSTTIINDTLVYGVGDIFTRLWDIKTKARYVLNNDYGSGLSSVAAVGDTVVIGLSGGRIKILNIKTKEFLHDFKGHTKIVTSIKIDGEKVVTLSKDGFAKLWNIKTAQLLRTFEGDTSRLCAVAIGDDKVLTASIDGVVTVWPL